MFLIFYNYFSVSLTWDPAGAKISKRYSSPTITAEKSFQIFLEFSSQWSSQNYFWDFWKLKFLRILFFFVNMGPYGRQNFNVLLLLQIAAKRFRTSPKFIFQWSSQYYVGIFKIETLMNL